MAATHGERALSSLQLRRPVAALARERTSVRTYAPGALQPELRAELQRACAQLNRGPLGAACRFALLEAAPLPEDAHKPLRLGTYGMIRGAQAFLAGAVRRAAHDLEDYGYLFECLLLKAWDLGLGSCWLGGTFTRGPFTQGLSLGNEELLPAVSPVGRPAARPRLVDGVIRFGAGSARRRPWSQLFFVGDWQRPLEQARAGRLGDALETLRLAPSASNRQPWRLLRESPEGPYHLYLQRSPGYRWVTAVDLQRVDMGIAMAHFDLGAAEAGMPGAWAVGGAVPAAGPERTYVATWRGGA